MFLLSKVNLFVIFLMKRLHKLSDWIGSEYSEGKYRANIALGTIFQATWTGAITLWILFSGAVFTRPGAVLVGALCFALYFVTAVLSQRAVQRGSSKTAGLLLLAEAIGVCAVVGILLMRVSALLSVAFILLIAISWLWGGWRASYFGWGLFKKSKQRRDAAAQAGQQAHAANHAQQFPAAPPAGYSGPQPGQPHQPDVGPSMTQRFGEPPRHNPTPQPPQGHTSGDEWGLPPH